MKITIREIWEKVIDVDDPTESAALISAMIDYADEYQGSSEGIPYDPAGVKKDVQYLTEADIAREGQA